MSIGHFGKVHECSAHIDSASASRSGNVSITVNGNADIFGQATINGDGRSSYNTRAMGTGSSYGSTAGPGTPTSAGRSCSFLVLAPWGALSGWFDKMVVSGGDGGGGDGVVVGWGG